MTLTAACHNLVHIVWNLVIGVAIAAAIAIAMLLIVILWNYESEIQQRLHSRRK